MRANGNGYPQIWGQNLLQLWRGECPYERVKGLDPRLIDPPAQIVAPQIMQEAEWLIETYEPRVTVDAIRIEEKQDGTSGGFVVTADVSEV